MKKRIVSVLLTMAMAVTMFTGCGNKPAEEKNDGTEVATEDYGSINFDEEAYTINMPVITLGDTPPDLQMVQDTLNEYLIEKINAQVELEAISIANLTNTYTMKASGQEKMDVVSMLPASSQLLPMVSSNMLLGMDDLLAEYGQDIITDAGDILDVGKVGGTQYFIPVFEAPYVAKGGLSFNSELVKKYELEDEIKSIQTLSDLEPLLAMIQEKEPSVIPFTAELAGVYQSPLYRFDSLGDGFGVLDFSAGDELKVVDMYETDTFMEDSKLMRDWFEKGYISKDAAISQDGGSTTVPAGAAFCAISTYAPNQDEGFDLTKDMVEIPLAETAGTLTSNSYLATGFSIAAGCERPDKVMQFLNLLYSDSYVGTLLMRGIEGVHYTVNEDGLLEGLNMDSGYYITFGQFGDHKLEGIPVEFGTDYEQKRDAYCEECEYSPAFGFVFDSSSVATEVASCNAVVDEFYKSINCGSVDPEVEIPKFVKKLEAAGLQKIMDEKQKQLDAWAELQ